MPEPVFELFEHICRALNGRESIVLTPEEFPDSIVAGLQEVYQDTVTSRLVSRAIDDIQNHFARREAKVPFTYNAETGEFHANDPEYLQFISSAEDMRGDPKKARDFEVLITRRLVLRVTGVVHRVGWPRTTKSRKHEFLAHLMDLGFRKDVIYGRDKDGGLDVLWLPPFGAIPIRPIVSLQCKNSGFNPDAADRSTARAMRTLRRHSVRSADTTHMCCVVFSDYIDESHVEPNRDSNFVPLGLSDFAPLSEPEDPVIL